MGEVHGSIESREISNEIKDHSRAEINEYGKEKLPCGDISGKELIVVEGRADVINLMKNGVKNVIAMNGTNLPETIRELSKEKDLTLFLDGDRGGKLIARNVVDNANVKNIAVAPDGKEVEELTGKEIWANLRKKVSPKEFFLRKGFSKKSSEEKISEDNKETNEEELKKISDKNKGTGKAVLLDKDLNEVKKVSARSLNTALKKIENIYAIIIDGTATQTMIKSAEEVKSQIIVAKNFSTTDTKIKLLSL